MKRWLVTLVLAGALLCAGPAAGAERLLVIHPASWMPALTNFMAFKTRLGYDVTTATTESIAGTNTLTHAQVRAFLRSFDAGSSNANDSALLLGNFTVIPAPAFRVVPAGRDSPDAASYASDIYYRDLTTEFNRDGDGLFGEFTFSGVTQDFDAFSFAAAFAGIRHDLIIGRLPAQANWSAARVEDLLTRSLAFEHDAGAAKERALMSAGRIVTNLAPLTADSWDYVLKDLVAGLRADNPSQTVATVVHVDPQHADRGGMDYVVEGGDLVGDYVRGQNQARQLLQGASNFGFLCNVSHGGPQYDFALTRQGAGLPTNLTPCIAMSMSCASFDLGRVAWTSGVVVAYLGSSAVVTPDYFTVLPPNSPTNRMVSADVQALAARRIFQDRAPVGRVFREGFEAYLAGIQQPRAALTFAFYPAEVLRNVVGFQLIGDPTLVLGYRDQDADGLLDAEEAHAGTSATLRDSDGDGLPDGLEFYTPGLHPALYDGPDVDADGFINADEDVAGTDPLRGTDFLAVTNLQLASGEVTLRWPSVTGRLYTALSATQLTDGAWTPLASCTDVPGTGALLTCTNPVSAATGFLAIGVRRAP